MFTLKINQLRVMTILGVYDWEKKEKRPVVLDIEMHVAGHVAAKSDNIKDTVDYAVIEQRIVERLETGRYELIERLVADIGELILSLDSRIESVTIEATKPGALKHAKSVSVVGIFKANGSPPSSYAKASEDTSRG